MVNFIRHTAATDMYRKQDRQYKHIQLENIKKKTRPKTWHSSSVKKDE